MNNTNTNTSLSTLFDSAKAEGELPFESVMDAVLYALDHSAVAFNRRTRKGDAARAYAADLDLEEVKRVFVGASDRLDQLEAVQPDAAALVVLAVQFGIRAMAGDTPAAVYAPRWSGVEELLMDSLDFEAALDRTHQQWVQWFLDVAYLCPGKDAIYESLKGFLDVLYDGGAVHGRFYLQNSLAWSAWSCIGYPLCNIAQYPNGIAQIVEGAAILAALIRIHAGDAANGIAAKDAKELLDVLDPDTGKLASSFVSMTTGPGSNRQKAPFPDDFKELFNKEAEAMARKTQQRQQERETRLEFAKNELLASLMGRQ